MILKYFIKFKINNTFRTRYIKAKTYKQATHKLLDHYKDKDITYISFEGEPLPNRKENATLILKKKMEAKERKRKGAIKYFQKSGIHVIDK
tara:strand:+ start:76 stop:348 length:273 start_codon:yes stop_codon:yes gene_type:complete